VLHLDFERGQVFAGYPKTIWRLLCFLHRKPLDRKLRCIQRSSDHFDQRFSGLVARTRSGTAHDMWLDPAIRIQEVPATLPSQLVFL